MTTHAKIAANRRNAAKSTGPKTVAGKARSSKNATKHGLLSQQVLLSGEEESTLVAFARSLRAELDPIGELEALFVERIATCAWRLRRALAAEVALFDRPQPKSSATPSSLSPMLGPDLPIKVEGDDDLGATLLLRGGLVLANLSRYEASIERSFYKALHELQRVQAARKGKTIPAPAVVDVDLTVASSGCETT